MKRTCRALLRLYPYDYRAAFASEMLAIFEIRNAERPCRRWVELAGLLCGAAVEWRAKLTTDESTRGRSLPDLRMMRPVGVTQQSWFEGNACTSGTSR